MKKTLAEIIYLSVGTASISLDKFKELLEDLIQNDAFVEDEGKRIIDSTLQDMRENMDHYRHNLQLQWDETLEKLGFGKVRQIKDDFNEKIKDAKENPFTFLLRHPDH